MRVRVTVALQAPASLRPEQVHAESYRLMCELLEARRTDADLRSPRTASDADAGVITVQAVVVGESTEAAAAHLCAVVATMTEYPIAAPESVVLQR